MDFKKDDIVKIIDTDKYKDFSEDGKAIIYEKTDKGYTVLSADGHELKDMPEDNLEYVEHLDNAADGAIAAANQKMQERMSLPYIIQRFRNHRPLEVTSWLALFSAVGVKSQYFEKHDFNILQSEIMAMYEPFRHMILCEKDEMNKSLKEVLKNSDDFIKPFDDLYNIIEKNFPFTDEDKKRFIDDEQKQIKERAATAKETKEETKE